MRVCNVKHILGLNVRTEQHLVEYSEPSVSNTLRSSFHDRQGHISIHTHRQTLTPHINGCYHRIPAKMEVTVKYTPLYHLAYCSPSVHSPLYMFLHCLSVHQFVFIHTTHTIPDIKCHGIIVYIVCVLGVCENKSKSSWWCCKVRAHLYFLYIWRYIHFKHCNHRCPHNLMHSLCWHIYIH